MTFKKKGEILRQHLQSEGFNFKTQQKPIKTTLYLSKIAHQNSSISLEFVVLD